MIIHCTLYESIYDNEITDNKKLSGSWNDFCKFLKNPMIVENKQDAPLLSPVKFLDNDNAISFSLNGHVRRCKENVEFWYCLPIDIDGQMSIDEAVEKFKDYQYVLYTSHSHQTEKKPYDCFRMFFLLSEPVKSDDLLIRRDSLKQFIEFLDPSSLSVSRAFYVPSCSKEALKNALFYKHNGKTLNIMDFAPSAPIVYENTKHDAPDDQLKSLVLDRLYDLGNVHYETPGQGKPSWWKIGSAMIDGGYNYNDFELLSNVIRSDHPDRNCKAQWNSCKSKPISFGYLINILKNEFKDDWLKKKVVINKKYVDTRRSH